MFKNKNQKTETSLAIYLLTAAVSFLIATVVYFNGPDTFIILSYFMLLVLVSLFYNYKICLFTAACSIISYGLIISYLIYRKIIYPSPWDLLLTLFYFLALTIIISWLLYKIQIKPRVASPFPLEDRTRLLLNSLVDGIIILDREGQPILMNRPAEKILGIKEREALNLKFTAGFSPESQQTLSQVIAAGQNLGDFSAIDIQISKPNLAILQIITTPIKQKDELLGKIKILRDITREKESDKMKSELISIVSHQLRTPLSAVKWSVKMILDGDAGKITREQKTILAKGYRSNERMIHLVNDLLNVSSIEKGRFQYKFMPTSLEDLIERLINEFSYSLEEKNMTLKFKKPQKPLPKVKVDSSKIYIVLQNILSNAVNYTPSGGEIEIKMRPQKSFMEVSIKDNGMGIPRDQQHRLFTRFFRADNAVRMQTEGSGLGLFIAKNIIENHQGKIWAKSEENKGSTFYFTVPLAK